MHEDRIAPHRQFLDEGVATSPAEAIKRAMTDPRGPPVASVRCINLTLTSGLGSEGPV